MDVRPLKPDEVVALSGVFASEFRAPVPSPHDSIVFGVTEGDAVIGFVVIENLIHFGPMYVSPEWRGRGVNVSLSRYVAEHVPTGRSVYVIASNESVGKMAERAGLVKCEGVLYRKDF